MVLQYQLSWLRTLIRVSKLKLERLPSFEANGGIVGCVCVYVRKMEENYWWEHGHEKNNKLVEWKAFVDTMGIKSVDLTDKFLF